MAAATPDSLPNRTGLNSLIGKQLFNVGNQVLPRPNVGNIQYGTAGFRMNADHLDYVIFTVGMLASLRSRKLNGATIGVMITASHNPAEDNGVKLVDPMGEMLDASWEPQATMLTNCVNPEDFANAWWRLVTELRINEANPANVVFARDTRPSGSRLVKALTIALEATNTSYIDYKILTTPQLHYLVRATNTRHGHHPYGEVSEQGYYKKLADAFKRAMPYTSVEEPVTVDCANGVGAPKLKELMKHLPQEKGEDGYIQLKVVNDEIEKPEVLNSNCGADFVKTNQRLPPSVSPKNLERCCSLDGDADRIVYYFNDEGSTFRLLDGDRIATLAASFIGELVQKSGLGDKLKLAVVQTAYANGNSTKYIEEVLKLKVETTATGVKNLHHVAARYDIGVYFEANGHGTILFSDTALKRIRNTEPESPAQLENLSVLRALTDLINQTVGDALSDMLLVEVILAQKQYSISNWLGTYTDLPNKITKLAVPDRNLFRVVTGSAERRLHTPIGLQEEIDHIVRRYKAGRCFVRASGTENVVRVYGEAAAIYDCEHMISEVEAAVRAAASSPQATSPTLDPASPPLDSGATFAGSSNSAALNPAPAPGAAPVPTLAPAAAPAAPTPHVPVPAPDGSQATGSANPPST